MDTADKCQYCGGVVSSDDKKCPSCGAADPIRTEEPPLKILKPRTIEELKEYCAERLIPLSVLNCFIGEDNDKYGAFGIYSEGDSFFVYDNSRSRSHRFLYQGPDEEFAVKELQEKLLNECSDNRIYPRGTERAVDPKKIWKNILSGIKAALKQFIIFLCALFGFVFVVLLISSSYKHCSDGYYKYSEQRVWYKYGADWFYTNAGNRSGDWYDGKTPYVSEDHEDHYLGNSYDHDWGISDFKTSKKFEEYKNKQSESESESRSRTDSR